MGVPWAGPMRACPRGLLILPSEPLLFCLQKEETNGSLQGSPEQETQTAAGIDVNRYLKSILYTEEITGGVNKVQVRS